MVTVRFLLSSSCCLLAADGMSSRRAAVGDRFADPPYYPLGFRTYARTLI